MMENIRKARCYAAIQFYEKRLEADIDAATEMAQSYEMEIAELKEKIDSLQRELDAALNLLSEEGVSGRDL